MAPCDHLTGQVSFLTDAAHLLAKSSPGTSAYLMRQRNDLLLAHDVYPPDVQKQHVCASCGHIMMPGLLGDTLRCRAQRLVRSRRQRGRHRGPPPPKLVKAGGGGGGGLGVCDEEANEAAGFKKPTREQEEGPAKKIYICGMCHKFTEIELPSPPPIVRKKQTTTTTTTTGLLQSGGAAAQRTSAEVNEKPAASTTSAANASSKKRARNRKAGLQALLDQAQRDPVKKPGLTLADFMKK